MLGEKLSPHVDMEVLVFDTDGQMYADFIDAAKNKPLDIGRYIFVKFKQEFDQYEFVHEVEVYHDHSAGIIRAVVAFETYRGDKRVGFTSFIEDNLREFDRRKRDVNNAVYKLRQEVQQEMRRSKVVADI